MPGIPTLFQALDLTIDELDKQGLTSVVNVIKSHPGYAHLGVIGPAIGDFLPADHNPADGPHPTNYVRVWKNIFFSLADLPVRKGFLSTLTTLRDSLEHLAMIGSDEDADALVDFGTSGKGAEVKAAADNLQNLVKELSANARLIAGWISTGLKPRVDTANPTDPVPAPTDWQARDFLHWKKTGAFVRDLLETADATGDQRLKAYAYGYLIGYACRVTGSPFVNSIVGGPFRTQWWRQRLVRAYVDAWVYGFYQQNPRPTMTGDTPAPPYDTWPSLCDANLHRKLNLGAADPAEPAALLTTVATQAPFPPMVPDDFAQHWFQAVQKSFGASVPAGVGAGSLNGAYAMTWLMLWFQTSGAVLGILGCPPQGPQAPANCGKDKSELDPFHVVNGTFTGPPPADIDQDVDEGSFICGTILAILGFLPTPSGVVFDLIGDAVKTGAVDWDDVRCKIYWNREYLFNAIAGFKRLVALTGFGYPDPQVLQEDKQALALLGSSKPIDSARVLVKSRLRADFPSKVWITITPDEAKALEQNPDDPATKPIWARILNEFEKDPTAANPGTELPTTTAYPVAVYPSFFIDDPANPLTSGDVKTGGAGLFRPGPEGHPRFGSAVANAIDLFRHIDGGFPNWNLDGDRGMAWLTWQFKGATYDPGNVQAEPEA